MHATNKNKFVSWPSLQNNPHSDYLSGKVGTCLWPCRFKGAPNRQSLVLITTIHHNRFTALFLGPPGWADARRELLDFMVQGKINRGRYTDHPAGHHSIRTNQCPPPGACSECIPFVRKTGDFDLQNERRPVRIVGQHARKISHP